LSDLSELQARMTRALRRRRALETDSEAVAFADAEIAGDERLSPVERLEIYRVQFWLRHTSSLVEDYPGLCGVIGQSAWERLVEDYLAGSPPLTPTLRDLGTRLPEFVEQASWLEHHDLCVDMARLELAYLEAFDAPDVAPLDPARLAAIPEQAWERARMVLNPSLGLLAVRYPVADLRRRLRSDEAGHVPIPDPRPQNLAVYRRDLGLFDAVLSDGAFTLLRALERGEPLLAACEAAQSATPIEIEDVAAQIGGWFRDWARKGLVVDVVTDS